MNRNTTRVRIIGGQLDGAVFPADEVLPPLWEALSSSELEDEIEAGCGFGEWETGTRCRIISVNSSSSYVLDALFEYNGRQWLPVEVNE